METSITVIAQALNRLRLSRTETTWGPFDLTGNCKDCGCNGNEYYATKIQHPTGSGILVHNPSNGDWTKALLIPESEFTDCGDNNLELVEMALEWLAKD